MIGEFELIAKIASMSKASAAVNRGLAVGIGDDAAVIRSESGDYSVITTDMLVEGVHFDLQYFTFYEIGWRAVAANLSDVAAMGGKPIYIVVAIAIPQKVEAVNIEALYAGMNALCKQFDVVIIGGDTTFSLGGLTVSITALGTVLPEHLKKRSAAMVGDSILLTGTPGDSKAGLQALRSQDGQLIKACASAVRKHLTPLPRVAESAFLVSSFPLNAMIDVSDGVASELNHICKQSKVGAVIYQNKLPVSAQAKIVAAELTQKSDDYFLNGGEDSELLFTAPKTRANDICLQFSQRFELEITEIGTILPAEQGIWLEHDNGQRTECAATGWNHFQ